jgi:flagellar secretion chaperone FliS
MYAAHPATAAYKEAGVLTASPAQLVVMLYDGAGRFLRQAAAAMDEGDVARANDRLQRGEAIVQELLDTLDFDQGGEVATNLRDLYLFCLRHLSESRVERSPDKVRQVIRLLHELRGSWAELAAAGS